MVKRTPARDERGQILILTALSMTVLLGIAALSVDASFMYDKRNQLYAAADAAAKIGAAEVHRNPGVLLSDLKTFADTQVTATGFAPSACGSATPGTTSVCVNHPPATGPFAGNAGYVEAIVSRVTSTFFGNVLGFASLKPTGRAVAGTSFGTGCLTTVGGGSPGITITSPATGVGITALTCDVENAGNLDDGGKITAHSIGYAGTCLGGCVSDTPPATHTAAPSDPLVGLPAPSAADCNGGLPGTDITVIGTMPLTPGSYHNITFNAGSTQLTLAPGLYCVTGAVTANTPGSPVHIRDTGGVTIYLGPLASLTLNSNDVDINLQGQAAGVYKGIVFYQDRSNTTTVLMAKNTGPWVIEGVLYFPSATIDMKNANFAASNQCGIMISGALRMDKPDMTFDNRCGGFGGSPILTVSVAE